MRKEEQRCKRGLKTLVIIDYVIVVVPIIFFSGSENVVCIWGSDE